MSMDVFTWCQSCYWISWIFSERECVYTCYIHEKSESTYDIIFKAAVLQSQRQQTGYLYANLRLPIRLLCLLNIFFFPPKKSQVVMTAAKCFAFLLSLRVVRMKALMERDIKISESLLFPWRESRSDFHHQMPVKKSEAMPSSFREVCMSPKKVSQRFES